MIKSLFLSGAFAVSLFSSITGLAQATNNAKLQWHNARGLAVEGKGFSDTKEFFDRLPERAEGVVRAPVWNLSRDSAGMSVRFITDATTVSVRWKLRKESLDMPHMPASGVSGVDLYAKEGKEWRWAGAGRPDTFPMNEKVVVKGLSARTREFLLYLPLYNGVSEVEIGVPENAEFSSAKVREEKPVVFYGTSILQGGCASRPGMAYPSILGRRLHLPIVNLGFSGNGKSEPEMAELISEIDAAVFVFDSLPNLQPKEVAERVEPFLKTFRAKHPNTPIVLVEHVEYSDGTFLKTRREKYENANRELEKIFKRMTKAGDKKLRYVRADNLLGTDGEGTVDGTHPTDLGFMRMADELEPVLRRLLPKR